MPQFSDAQLSKWAQDYEKELTAKQDLILDRISLGVTAGETSYELPNYISNIALVLWQGKPVYPKGFRQSAIFGDTPYPPTQGVPFEYVFSGMGQRILRFLPAPQLTIAEYVGDLFTPAADEAAVIIEFYRTAKVEDATLKLPDWCRRYLLKNHVCMRAFKAEGPQQDLKAAQYYEQRLREDEAYISAIKVNMHQAVVRSLSDSPTSFLRKPGRPVLPTNFPG